MIVDFNAYDAPRDLTADVCIVGAGPAGITLARQLSRTPLRVCLLEGGGLTYDEQAQSLYDGADTALHTGLMEGRMRMFGGASNHWGGRCATLDPIDFERRDWAPFSGWPIGPDSLAPFYQQAIGICGFAGGWLSDAEVYRAMDLRPPTLGSDVIRTKVWRYTPRRPGESTGLNFAEAYRAELAAAPRLTTLLNANLTRLQMDEARRGVVSASVQGFDAGKRLTVRAKIFVLACGGVENARLLLTGDGETAIGNRHDVVGRYFLEHPRLKVARFHPAAAISPVQSVLNWNVLQNAPPALRSKGQVQLGLTLTPQAMRREKLLNASIDLYYQNASAQAGAAQAAGPPYSPEQVAHLEHRPIAIEAADLVVDLEQRADPDNRVTLGEARDRLGVRLPVVRWTVSDQERRTALRAAMFAGAELARWGYGRTKLDDWVQDPHSDLTPYLSPTFHFSGATRMAEDPRFGVVDSHCRVHGTENLFVAGSSVFPTNGCANPTLTIVALACRLADYLKATVSV